MKKRKTPVLLLSMLILLVGGVVVFGMSQGAKTVDQTSSPTAPSDGKTAPPSSGDVGEDVKSATTNAKGHVKAAEGDDGPSIAVHQTAQTTMPKPTGSIGEGTNTGWYPTKTSH